MKLTVGGFSVLYLQLALVFSMQPICIQAYKVAVFRINYYGKTFLSIIN